MKRLLLIFSIITLSLNAQDFNFYPGKTNIEEGPADKARDVKIEITNKTGANLRNWQWSIIEIDQPTDWFGLAICDNVNCYYNLTDSDTLTLASVKNDSTFEFKITFGPNSVDGVGNLKIAFFNPDDTTGYADTLTIGLDTWPLSIEDAKDQEVSIYPNPTSSMITVDLGSDQNVDVEVYNFLGQSVARQFVQGSRAQIDLSGLVEGTYFVAWMTDKGRVTRRVVKE